MLYEHASGGHIEDFRGAIVLPQIDLAVFEPLVWIAEPIGGHTDLFQPGRIIPGDDLRADDRSVRIRREAVDHVPDRRAVECRVIVNEQQVIGVGPHPPESPVDGASEAEWPRCTEITPPAAPQVALCNSFERRIL